MRASACLKLVTTILFTTCSEKITDMLLNTQHIVRTVLITIDGIEPW